MIFWEKESECLSYTDNEMDNWKNRLHDVSALHYISTEVRELHFFDGSGEVETFLRKLEEEVLEERWLWALNFSLCATPVRWWETHKVELLNWETCREMMVLQFKALLQIRFTGKILWKIILKFKKLANLTSP